jgi:hypothetical protein
MSGKINHYYPRKKADNKKEFFMKNVMKILGVILLVAIIGIGIVSCVECEHCGGSGKATDAAKISDCPTCQDVASGGGNNFCCKCQGEGIVSGVDI